MAVEVVEVVAGRDQGVRFALAAVAATIGRDPASDVVLTDARVSRRHARLWTEADLLLIEDLGSTSGTMVNGVAISRPTPLKQGDRVAVGETEMVVLWAPVPAATIAGAPAVPAAAPPEPPVPPAPEAAAPAEAPPAPAAPAPVPDYSTFVRPAVSRPPPVDDLDDQDDEPFPAPGPPGVAPPVHASAPAGGAGAPLMDDDAPLEAPSQDVGPRMPTGAQRVGQDLAKEARRELSMEARGHMPSWLTRVLGIFRRYR